MINQDYTFFQAVMKGIGDLLTTVICAVFLAAVCWSFYEILFKLGGDI